MPRSGAFLDSPAFASRCGFALGSLRKNGTNGETDALASRDSNLVAATNGFDSARRNVAQIPGTKPHQAHLVSLGDILTYNLGKCINDFARLFQIQARPGGNLVNQFVFTNYDMSLVRRIRLH